jgi:hypothetical protein
MSSLGSTWDQVEINFPVGTPSPQTNLTFGPDRKVDIKDNHLGIKLIPMISTWDQVDPIFPVRDRKWTR